MVSEQEIINEKDGSVMLYVPAGPYFMWHEKKSFEIKDFYIDKHPITNSQYNKFIEEAKHVAPAFWNDSRFNHPTQPVVGVSWEDANV